MSKAKKSKEKQFQYYNKIMGALNELFNDESDYYIDVSADEFDGNAFFLVLATRVPQLFFTTLTSNEMDPLAFNHAMNRLIMQDFSDDNN
jgi:hypothetical protein